MDLKTLDKALRQTEIELDRYEREMERLVDRYARQTIVILTIAFCAATVIFVENYYYFPIALGIIATGIIMTVHINHRQRRIIAAKTGAHVQEMEKIETTIAGAQQTLPPHEEIVEG